MRVAVFLIVIVLVLALSFVFMQVHLFSLVCCLPPGA